MSTRSQILVEGHNAIVYRHSDGYPNGHCGVLKFLVPFVKDFLTIRGEDPEYMTAHLVAELINNAKRDRKRFAKRMKNVYNDSPETIKRQNNMVKYCGFGVEGYDGTLHGDIEYLYVIKTKTQEIEIRIPDDSWDWDNTNINNTRILRTVKLKEYREREHNGRFVRQTRRNETGQFLKRAA